jgi:hypothetical protein
MEGLIWRGIRDDNEKTTARSKGVCFWKRRNMTCRKINFIRPATDSDVSNVWQKNGYGKKGGAITQPTQRTQHAYFAPREI